VFCDIALLEISGEQELQFPQKGADSAYKLPAKVRKRLRINAGVMAAIFPDHP
jgi:hypothetical protein